MTWKSIHWNEVKEGEELPVHKREITRTTVIATAIATRDFTPVHHDHEAAQKSGANDIFLNILTTGGFIGKYMTDWSGPECQLKKIVIRLGATCYPGDTLTSTGKVVKKYTQGNEHLVDVEYNLSVAMGPHAWGTVTMALPTKGQGGSHLTIRECRGAKPLCWGLGGVPPTSKVPQEWGIQGVEKRFQTLF